MSSFNIFNIAGSGMSAQSVRLNTTASNLANADSVSGDPNQVYKAKHPLFEAIRNGLGKDAASSGVAVKGIFENPEAPSARYEPGNPLADQRRSDEHGQGNDDGHLAARLVIERNIWS
jgi:flagellar basal-body rod protein FlgC